MGNTKSKQKPKVVKSSSTLSSQSSGGNLNNNNSSNNNGSPKASQNPTLPKPKDTAKPSRSPSKASVKEDTQVFSMKRLEELFNKYKEEDDDQMLGPNGMVKLCQDLDVDPEDVVTLVMAYRLKAKQMGYFSKEEFTKGFEAMGVDSIDKMKKQISKLRVDLDDAATFKNIYRFAFDFAKEDQQKCIDMEMAQGLIGLLLVDRYPLANSFSDFLKQQESYKGLNIDQWTSLLEFCKAINPDLSNYDENGAWPCVLDEWATWVKEKKGHEEGTAEGSS